MSEQDKNRPISEEEARKIADIMLGGWKEPIILDGEQIRVATQEQHQRDTHFAGFARALWSELLANTRTFHSDYEESQQTTIARRAYDLVCHVLITSGIGLSACQDISDAAAVIREYIPDLTELPEEEREQ